MKFTKKTQIAQVATGCLFLLTLLSTTAMAAADVAAALSHPDRPSADAENDARRKPAEVLNFAGLETGMSVLELEAGGGYYTEIISRAVGPNGSVILQHAPGLMSFVGDGINQRTADNRLANVTVSITNFDELDAPDNSIDMVTWIQGPHELGFAPEGNSMGDPQESFREIARALKPGGLLVASDHIAPDGAGIEAGGTLHRVEESVVTELARNAGLSVVRTSNLFKNSEDPLDVGVFAPAVRGKTSQFLVVYQK
jgi:predicted methyltransferase